MSRMGALLSLALYDPDWRLAQSACLDRLGDCSEDVIATAVLGIGHIARRHHRLDLAVVLSRLEALKGRSGLIDGRINDTLDDISIYIRSVDA